jgi:hypothetical protein
MTQEEANQIYREFISAQLCLFITKCPDVLDEVLKTLGYGKEKL